MPTRPNEDIPEPWLSFLRELDSAVQEEIRLDCMGGFVVTMVYGFSRPTADLDVLEIAPTQAGRAILQLGMQGGPLHKKYKVYTKIQMEGERTPMYQRNTRPSEARHGP